MRDFPHRHRATVSRSTSISRPYWSWIRNGPRTSSGPSRYGVIVATSFPSASLNGLPLPLAGRLHRRLVRGDHVGARVDGDEAQRLVADAVNLVRHVARHQGDPSGGHAVALVAHQHLRL